MTLTVDGPGSTDVMRKRPRGTVHHALLINEPIVKLTWRTCPKQASGWVGSVGSQSRQSSSPAAPTLGTDRDRDPWTCWLASQDTDPSSTGTAPRYSEPSHDSTVASTV